MLLLSLLVPRATDGAEHITISHDPRAAKLVRFEESSHFTFPLYAENFIQEADRNDIPWQLLPCIERQESGGGRRYIAGTHNPFGWASGAVAFESEQAGIAEVSRQLGSGRHYAGRSIDGKIESYNGHPEYRRSITNCIAAINNQPTQ